MVHSSVNKDEIKGAKKGKILQLLYLSKFHGKINELANILIENLSELDLQEPGINYFNMFIFYIAASHETKIAIMIYRVRSSEITIRPDTNYNY